METKLKQSFVVEFEKNSTSVRVHVEANMTMKNIDRLPEFQKELQKFTADWFETIKVSAMDVWITNPGNQKIGAIKEIRALTGLSLKEAKDVIESPTPIKANVNVELSRTEALHWKDRFAAIGCSVYIGDERLAVMA